MIFNAPTRVRAEYQPGMQRIFTAGGMPPPDPDPWMSEFCSYMDQRYEHLILTNPWRDPYPTDRYEVQTQIEWETTNLRSADLIVFWFAPNRLQPMTWFEYGKTLMAVRDKDYAPKVYVAAHIDYSMRLDVLHRTALECPDMVVYSTIDELKALACNFLNEIGQPKRA